MFDRLGLLLAIIAIAHAGVIHPQPRDALQPFIVGGEDTTIEENPWQISMMHISSHRCGGSIVSPIKIVTAAHCIAGTITLLVSIRAGSSLRTSGGVTISVNRQVSHSEYNVPTQLNNDIGLLFLATPLTYGPGIQPINVADSNMLIPNGVHTAVTGWGTLSQGGAAAMQLQKVMVPIVSRADCAAAYHNFAIPVTNTMVCAGYIVEGGRDACQGDSGGPLKYGTGPTTILYGIVSWGDGCAQPGRPGVYASAAFFSNWIEQTN